MNKKLKNISKQIIFVLRHSPESYNLKLDSNGYIPITEICNKFNISIEDLYNIIENDDKKRFELFGLNIRACQGHSIHLEDIESTWEINKDNTSLLYHGTCKDNLMSIIEKGIFPMSRQYVHLNKNYDVALKRAKTVSKDIKDAIILVINPVKILSYKTTNDVILSKYVKPGAIVDIYDDLDKYDETCVADIISRKIMTPDGTILETINKHDYVSHLDKNGECYIIDGGKHSFKSSINIIQPFDLSIYECSPHIVIREHFKWTTLDNKILKLSEMEIDHIINILKTQTHISNSTINILTQEIAFRKINKI